jgi:anti-sigma factor RsiW
MSIGRENVSERDEIEMLLPWYVTGRLDAAEHARVAAFASRHPDIARQIEMIETERRATIQVNEAIAVPSPRQLSLATARGAEANGVLLRVGEALQRLLAGIGPRGLAFAAGVAGLVVLAQTATIGGLLVSRTTETYQAASGQRNDGAYVLVRFVDTATFEAVNAALTRNGVTIASGPKPGGLYRVRIGDKKMSRAEREQKVQDLKRQTELIDLVTPAQ